MAWNNVDLPTFARPTYGEMVSSRATDEWQSSAVLRTGNLTIPLFKLFPGRPRGIFSSWTTFLGGILLLDLAKDRQGIIIDTRRAIGACPRAAGLAARGRKVGIREEKGKGKVMRSVVVNDLAAGSLCRQF